MNLALALLGIFLNLIFIANSFACQACFGNPSSSLTQGLKFGMLGLLGFVFMIFTGIIAFIIQCHRRAKLVEETSQT